MIGTAEYEIHALQPDGSVRGILADQHPLGGWCLMAYWYNEAGSRSMCGVPQQSNGEPARFASKQEVDKWAEYWIGGAA